MGISVAAAGVLSESVSVCKLKEEWQDGRALRANLADLGVARCRVKAAPGHLPPVPGQACIWGHMQASSQRRAVAPAACPLQKNKVSSLVNHHRGRHRHRKPSPSPSTIISYHYRRDGHHLSPLCVFDLFELSAPGGRPRRPRARCVNYWGSLWRRS